MPRARKTDSMKLRLEKQREVRRQIAMEIVVLDDVQRMYYRSKDEYKHPVERVLELSHGWTHNQE